MPRCFLKLFYLFGSINSAWILIKLRAGQNYTGANIIYTIPIEASNDSNLTELWPIKMRLRLINYGYFCKMPSFNVDIDIDEESVIRAWYLPPKTQLSPIMREIGHCHLAAKKMAAEGIEFDENNCNCVGWWPVLVFAISLVCFPFNVYRLIIGFPIDDDENPDYATLFIIHWMWLLAWFIAWTTITLYFRDIFDIGVSYTSDGYWFSRSYYSKSPEWGAVWFQINLFTFLALIAEFIVLAVYDGIADEAWSWLFRR